MKKIIIIFIFMIVFNINIYANEKDKDKVDLPKVNALGAILIDYSTGRILWEKNSYDRLAMASTTKIMTAIVALENADLNDIVKISSVATKAPEVKMYLKKDEEIKLEYLIYAIMLQSYNDAAIAIAEHVGGNVEDFCKMMTNKAKELGAMDTSFETPNGLDGDKHYSTAYDMAIITKYALRNEKFKEIINTRSLVVGSNKKLYNLINKNRFLYEMSGANGVKTGFTRMAGHCFVGSVKKDDMQLISVVLGSGWGARGKQQKWIDTKSIMEYGFSNFKNKRLIKKNELIDKSIDVEKSKTKNINLYFAENFLVPLSKEDMKTVKIIIKVPNVLEAPIERNEKVGIAEIYIKGKLEKEVDLLSSNNAAKYDLKDYLEKIFINWLNLTIDDIIGMEL